jgi:hypothetical protein
VDQVKRAVIAILDGLRRLAPARFRMALAAETLAGAVASFDRMMPTRTLIAVWVWLRASERISASDFAIQVASETESEPSP